jgi:2-iminoacetate synthase ThiH
MGTMTTATFDGRMDRIVSGEPLTADEVRELCGAPEVLPLGMLADAVRRRWHGARATYVRVAMLPLGQQPPWDVEPAAHEIRLTGAPESPSQALDAVRRARATAGARVVSGFSWRDIERLASSGASPGDLLSALRAEGLDAVGELHLDAMTDAGDAIGRLQQAGFTGLCLGIDAPAGDWVGLWLRASELQQRFACIQAINPLPAGVRSLRPTTGYADVKMVAAARLAAPGIQSVQVDWQRYGPKLAQVALTFGADDVWGISASDAAPEGRRRAPVEEIRRNVEAAGFEPIERDGRFAPLA